MISTTQEKDMAGDLEARLQAAFEEAIGRQDGVRSPQGGYTSPGIWEPSPEERQPCCDEVNKPTPGWGWSLKKHCESSKHVAQLFGVPESALVKRVRQFKYERNKGRRAAITFAGDGQPSLSPLAVAHQVERLVAKVKAELGDLEKAMKGGDYASAEAPDTDELRYWLRQMK